MQTASGMSPMWVRMKLERQTVLFFICKPYLEPNIKRSCSHDASAECTICTTFLMRYLFTISEIWICVCTHFLLYFIIFIRRRIGTKAGLSAARAEMLAQSLKSVPLPGEERLGM